MFDLNLLPEEEDNLNTCEETNDVNLYYLPSHHHRVVQTSAHKEGVCKKDKAVVNLSSVGRTMLQMEWMDEICKSPQQNLEGRETMPTQEHRTSTIGGIPMSLLQGTVELIQSRNGIRPKQGAYGKTAQVMMIHGKTALGRGLLKKG